MEVYSDITKSIGNTPLIKINNLTKINNCKSCIFAKQESFNPMGSVKDRLAISLIEDAEKRNILNPQTTIIEPTSGNTGIGLAYICAVKRYKLILTMPETMSIERRQLLTSFGAEIVLTSGELGMKGAIEKADILKLQIQNSVILNQFENPANPEIHRKTTAIEIWNDTKTNIDIFVSGVGTGGTITGVGEVLKEKNKNIRIVAVEPFDSSVLSGFDPGPHKIQGIGAGFIPKILNTKIIDEIIRVKNDEAIKTCRQLASEEGILSGISSGAAMFAAIEIAKKNQNKNIVVILPDTGERYLSTGIFE